MHRAQSDDTAADLRAALSRLLDYFLAAAGSAASALEPSGQHHRPRIDPPGTPIPALSDPAAARAWLDVERPTLVACISHAAHHDWPIHTKRLAAILYRYLDGGHYPDAVTIYTQAVAAARYTSDHTGQVHALINLGSVNRLRGRYNPAAAHYQRAARQ